MDDYQLAAHRAIDLLAEHVSEARAGHEPVTVQPKPDALAVALETERWIREGGMDETAFAEWLPRYLAATVRLHHPGSMVHQVEDAIIELEVEELERIRPDRLPRALERCLAAGRRPIALVALAPATSTGLHDDLGAIGAFCAEQQIWFHADAAHGASALLSDRHRYLLEGIELADSVVWDAHKLFAHFGPVRCCAGPTRRRPAQCVPPERRLHLRPRRVGRVQPYRSHDRMYEDDARA